MTPASNTPMKPVPVYFCDRYDEAADEATRLRKRGESVSVVETRNAAWEINHEIRTTSKFVVVRW